MPLPHPKDVFEHELETPQVTLLEPKVTPTTSPLSLGGDLPKTTIYDPETIPPPFIPAIVPLKGGQNKFQKLGNALKNILKIK